MSSRRKDSTNDLTDKEIRDDPVLQRLRDKHTNKKRFQTLIKARNPDLTPRQIDEYLDNARKYGLTGKLEKRKGPTYWMDPVVFDAWYDDQHRKAS